MTLTFERAVTHSQFNREIETVRVSTPSGATVHGQVRKSIGHELVGDALNQAWGVMDILAVTDFPDIRLKAAIQSINEGNVLIILVRVGTWLGCISSSTSSSKTSESTGKT